ncbi:MAG: paraquat-inducible protein A [Caldimonas sp.]
MSDREIARCSRCDAIIGRGHRLSIGSVLALTIAAAAAWLVAVTAPLMTIDFRGGAESATLPQAILFAWRAGQPFVAFVAALTALIAPAAFIGLRLYVLAPLALGSRPAGFAWCVRLLHQAGRWNMIEVFTVGVLLSLVRLAGLADASPGLGLFALGAVTVLFATIESAGLKHLWWHAT